MSCFCKCNGCKEILLVSEINAKDTEVVFVLPKLNLYNGERVCFVIPSSLDIPNEVLPIFLQIGNITFPWLAKSGNFVYTDQVKNRRLYVGRVRTDTSALMNERCNLNRTSFDFPVISIESKMKSITNRGGDVQ